MKLKNKSGIGPILQEIARLSYPPAVSLFKRRERVAGKQNGNETLKLN